MKRSWLAAPLTLWLALIVSPGALAAGGPVPPAQGSYIGVPGAPYEYAASNAGSDTVVKVRRRGAGPAVSALRIAGDYGIPVVDYGGTTTGLSADGRTLILAQIPQVLPPRATRLLVLGTAPLAVRARITLPGWSTVDAISPGGRWLYLIHYASSNIGDYAVLAYDLVEHRLLAKPIVDPRDRDEAMVGFPMSRVMSPGDGWAYTLYYRPSDVPFVHALDTTGRRAVCIDLPSLGNPNLGNAHLGLGPGGTTIDVDINGVTEARIDTRTFKVSPGDGHAAAAPDRPATRAQPGIRRQGGAPWELIAFLIAALAVIAAAPRLAGRKPGDDEVPAA